MNRTKSRRLLIDADVICYRAAWRGKETYDFGDGEEPLSLLDFRNATEYIAEFHASMLKLGEPLYCLSDRAWNFRKDLFPDYKANRDDKARPELLGHSICHIKNNFPFLILSSLEADDVMGLKSRGAAMVTIDKDLLTVPGLHYNPDHPDMGFRDVCEGEAFYHHMSQTLTGDSTDNYKGIPGIGPKKAVKILGDAGEFPARGKRLRLWMADMWDRVVAAYKSNGLTEDDARLNARLAHILHPGEYDAKNKKVRLWEPPTSTKKGEKTHEKKDMPLHAKL